MEPYWARGTLTRYRSAALGAGGEALAAGPLVGLLAEADVLAGGQQVA